jgi:hypothetical protein
MLLDLLLLPFVLLGVIVQTLLPIVIEFAEVLFFL